MRRKWKWGRIAAAVAGVAVVATLVAGAADAPTEKKVLIYTVQKGDTLWTICEEHLMLNSDKYILEFKHEIEQANDLQGGIIHPGQKIVIPYEVRK